MYPNEKRDYFKNLQRVFQIVQNVRDGERPKGDLWQILNHVKEKRRIHQHTPPQPQQTQTLQTPKSLDEDLKKLISDTESFFKIESALISQSLLNQVDYTFKEKREVTALAFILHEKRISKFASFAEFEKAFGKRYSQKLNKDFAESKIGVVIKQINRLKSALRIAGLSGFEATEKPL